MFWLIAGWVVCGFVASGIAFAHFQRKFPGLRDDEFEADSFFSSFIGMCGPIGLVASLAYSRLEFGWKLPFTRGY